MKKHLYIFVLCTLSFCTLVGCKEQNRPETFISNVSRPTWTVPTDYDYSSSMTAVVKVDLAAQYPDKATGFVLESNDLLAAFSGETCLGVTSPQEGIFYLYIVAPNGSNEKIVNEQMIKLVYYSGHYKNLFETKDAFPFANDTQQGTIAEPFVPTLVEVK